VNKHGLRRIKRKQNMIVIMYVMAVNLTKDMDLNITEWTGQNRKSRR